MIPTAPIPTQAELDSARLIQARFAASMGARDSGCESLAPWLRDNERRQLRARARRICSESAHAAFRAYAWGDEAQVR